MPDAPATRRNPWFWIPSLYLAQGLPNVVVMTVSVIMYKNLGLSNTDIALYTSWLNLPWVIKPLWSPVVDLLKTRRQWIWLMQLLVGAGLAGVALTIPAPDFFRWTLVFLWLLAFSSATHDIAADGFYMLATTEREQAFFVGIRSTFFRVATITGQGLLVMLAGAIQSHSGLPTVELSIAAQPDAAVMGTFDSTNPQLSTNNSQPVSLRLLPSTTNLAIAPVPRTQAEVRAIVEAAKAWNIEHGFSLKSEERESSGPSWWKRNVSGPLGDWLRRHFGPESALAASDSAGNVGVVFLRMSAKPAQDLTGTVWLQSGDKSLGVAEGVRLQFTAQNWDQPAAVVFQLDPKLRSASGAVYEVRSGNIPLSWMICFGVLAGLMTTFGACHFFLLPRPAADQPGQSGSLGLFLAEFLRTFAAFFRKDGIGVVLCFLLFYRFAEAQLVKMVSPFLLDSRETGGLGLTTGEVGLVYGTVGIIALTLGGIMGGMAVYRHGLRAWLWPMVFIMHLPDAMFVYLAYAQPHNLWLISTCVGVEQFGYGFGFAAYMLYMIQVSRGPHATAHYAICTGFMALGMMLPGMWSGWLQDHIGYQHFFLWVMLATLPGFAVVKFVKVDAGLGKQ